MLPIFINGKDERIVFHRLLLIRRARKYVNRRKKHHIQFRGKIFFFHVCGTPSFEIKIQYYLYIVSWKLMLVNLFYKIMTFSTQNAILYSVR